MGNRALHYVLKTVKQIEIAGLDELIVMIIDLISLSFMYMKLTETCFHNWNCNCICIP